MVFYEKLVPLGEELKELLAKEAKAQGVPKLVFSPSEIGGFELTVEAPKPVEPESEPERVEPGWAGDDDVCYRSGQRSKASQKQIENSAGGFVFQVSDETRVRRYLIMGTTGGTFYISEKELAIENLADLMRIIDQGEAAMVLREIKEISLGGRNPKQEPVMFALALCAKYRIGHLHSSGLGSEAAKLYANYLKAMHAAALELLQSVCRIPTHLFMFVDFAQKVAKHSGIPKGSTGWGRAFRKAICDWYAAKSPRQMAMAVTKYGKRGGWSHRDLFRLAHPTLNYSADDDQFLEREQIYHFIVKGELAPRKRTFAQAELDLLEQKPTEKQLDSEEKSEALNLIETYKSLNKDSAEQDVVVAIKQKGLVREHIPPELLNSVPIWKALLDDMPMTALIRNLAKMTAINVIDADNVQLVCGQITNQEAIYKSRIHPMQILVAHHMYRSGKGDKGKLTWGPKVEIVAALEKAFYTSFKNVEPTGKRYCFAFDVSGSMCQSVLGTTITAREASVAMGMIGLRTEQNAETVAFCDALEEIPWKKEWKLDETCDYFNKLRFGATDCALPMVWAKEQKKKFDVFVVFTDNETYYGKIHPHDALCEYREASGIHDARLAVMGMCANQFTIADPDDAGMMDFQGFDPCFPQMLADFALGRI
ncbi:unnamed protein product, partial [Mesorhabditis spiculigera]